MPWNKPPDHTVSVRAAANAKVLRRRMTEPEKRLWWHLRHRLPLKASHFRRQVAVGPYVVDFCCYPARLVVEVDGNQHGRDDAIARDAQRTAYLEKHGFRVLRFSNRDFMREIDVVLDTVHAALAVPTPSPSPQEPAPDLIREGSESAFWARLSGWFGSERWDFPVKLSGQGCGRNRR